MRDGPRNTKDVECHKILLVLSVKRLVAEKGRSLKRE